MNKYRTIRMVMLAVQVGLFGVLAVYKMNNVGPVGGWSWWIIYAPLYTPLLVSICLFMLVWLWDKAYNYVYPPSPSNMTHGTSYRTDETYRCVSSAGRYSDL